MLACWSSCTHGEMSDTENHNCVLACFSLQYGCRCKRLLEKQQTEGFHASSCQPQDSSGVSSCWDPNAREFRAVLRAGLSFKCSAAYRLPAACFWFPVSSLLSLSPPAQLPQLDLCHFLSCTVSFSRHHTQALAFIKLTKKVWHLHHDQLFWVGDEHNELVLWAVTALAAPCHWRHNGWHWQSPVLDDSLTIPSVNSEDGPFVLAVFPEARGRPWVSWYLLPTPSTSVSIF